MLPLGQCPTFGPACCRWRCTEAPTRHHDARQQGEGRVRPGVADAAESRRAGDRHDAVGHHARAALLWRPPAPGRQRHVDAASAECVPLRSAHCAALAYRKPSDAANPEVLYVHNSSSKAQPLRPLGAPQNEQYAWAASPAACPAGALGSCAAVALFNAGNATAQVTLRLDALGLTQPRNASGADDLPDGVHLCGRNLWSRKQLVASTKLSVFAPKARADACASGCSVALAHTRGLRRHTAPAWHAAGLARRRHVRPVGLAELHLRRGHVRAAARRRAVMPDSAPPPLCSPAPKMPRHMDAMT